MDRVAAALIGSWIALVARTALWTVSGDAEARRLLSAPGGLICAAWHGRLLMGPMLVPVGRRAAALVAPGRDGDLAAHTLARVGTAAIRAAASDPVKGRRRGGVGVFRRALKALRERGAMLGVAADGPVGPAGHLAPGVSRLAALAQVPVVSVAWCTRFGVSLERWDGMLVPLPFGRGAIIFGPVRRPPKPTDKPALRAFTSAVEADLRHVTATADMLCGRTPDNSAMAAVS